MGRIYEIFENFRDGCSIWRDSVPGLFETQRKLQELAERSESEFFAIDLKSPERLLLDLHPSHSRQFQTASNKVA